jgi:ribosome modulation factor
MRIDINEQAWNRGFWDGDSGKPSLACPYGVESDERLSWASGYIEGKAFRNGYIATPPGSRVPLRKSALAAELCAVPLCSTAPSSAAQDPRQRGVKIARRSGVMCGRRPHCKRNLAFSFRSGAVMCPACCCGHVTAGPDVIRGSGPDQFFGLEAL